MATSLANFQPLTPEAGKTAPPDQSGQASGQDASQDGEQAACFYLELSLGERLPDA
jgi:hypothetical protein